MPAFHASIRSGKLPAEERGSRPPRPPRARPASGVEQALAQRLELAPIVWVAERSQAAFHRLARLHMAHQIRAIDVCQAKQRLSLDEPAEEWQPLIKQFNNLMERVDRTCVQLEGFNADVAHELRTPLAGCKTQLHVASQSTDDRRRQNALQQASVSVDHMEALLKQLLFFARLDPAAPPIERHYFQLGALVRRVAAALGEQIDRADVVFLFQERTSSLSSWSLWSD